MQEQVPNNQEENSNLLENDILFLPGDMIAQNRGKGYDAYLALVVEWMDKIKDQREFPKAFIDGLRQTIDDVRFLQLDKATNEMKEISNEKAAEMTCRSLEIGAIRIVDLASYFEHGEDLCRYSDFIFEILDAQQELYEDKVHYPTSAQQVYGEEARTAVLDEDAMDLDVPLVEPISKKTNRATVPATNSPVVSQTDAPVTDGPAVLPTDPLTNQPVTFAPATIFLTDAPTVTPTDAPVSDTVAATVNDVLFGRGTGPNEWAGNKFFREQAELLKPEYQTATKNEEKSRIATKLIDKIYDRGGKFLECVSKKKQEYIIVSDTKRIQKKAQQCIRE